MSEAFRKVREELIHQGAVVAFYRSTFVGPDGLEFDRDVVKHPGAVSVVAVTDDDHVLLVRQYRAALEEDLLEIVAGKRDVPGEDPRLTAERELEEEVGHQAASYELLSVIDHSPGFCDERNHVYLATGLVETEQQVQGIEEQHMTVERVPLSEVRPMIADGRLSDAKSVIGLLMALERLEAGRS